MAKHVCLCVVQALLAAGPHGVNSLVGNILKDTEQERGNLLSSTMHRPKHSPGGFFATPHGVTHLSVACTGELCSQYSALSALLC